MTQNGYRPDNGKQKTGGKKLDGFKVFLIAWAALVLVAAFAISSDAGLYILLAGAAVCVIRWALRKDKQIAAKRKAKQGRAESKPVTAERAAPQAPQTRVKVEYVGPKPVETIQRMNVRVAGVTYANGRRQRQTILREIYWHDKAYAGKVVLTLKVGEYEGKQTVEVWANEEMIGYVPAAQKDYFLEHWHQLAGLSSLDVSGGGETKGGEPIPFGASFVAAFDLSK